jgi:hypothetical protein
MPQGLNPDGAFAAGNPGGPGRPRRAVERECLAILFEVADLDSWRAICQKAVEEAKAGDPGVRNWLARYLLGAEPLRLLHLAADETVGFTAAKEVELEGRNRREAHFLLEAFTPAVGADSKRT